MKVCVSLILLLSQAVLPAAEPPASSSVNLLRQHLELAQTGEVFVTFLFDDVKIWIRNLPLKDLPILDAVRVGPAQFRVSRVRLLQPATRVKEVVEQVDEIEEDTAGAVSSLEETVGLMDMADNYCVYLEDGSVLVVKSRGQGLTEWFRWRVMRGRAAAEYLWKRMSSSEVKFIEVEMASEAAREIYWVLRQQGAPVIF